MGLLDALKLDPAKAGPTSAPANGAEAKRAGANGAQGQGAEADGAAATAPEARPEPGVPGRDAAAFESAKKLRGGMKTELDKRWREAVTLGGKLEGALKAPFVGQLQEADKHRKKAASLSGDPPGQVVFMAKALMGLKVACKSAGHPLAGAGADDVAYDDGTNTVKLDDEKFAAPPVAAAPGDDGDSNRLSGAHWCAKFPTSRSTADLISPFGSNCDDFIAAIEAGGGSVAISATLRPKQRAYLMHWAWQVGKAGFDPAKVPAESGVDIEWDHGDKIASVNGAEAMVSGYGLAYEPSLTSRHIQGRAIDMTIGGIVGKTMKDKDGTDVEITSVKKLHAVGADYGVVKLVSDPPHWSDDGH